LGSNNVKCWGNGQYGKLGYGDEVTRGTTPSTLGSNLPAVDLGSGIVARSVQAADNHTCALTASNQVKCWGSGSYLGYQDSITRGDGASEMGSSLPYVNLGTNRYVRQLSTGPEHSCAILDSGELKCWGSGTYGRLGYGDTTGRGMSSNTMGTYLPAVDLGTNRVAVSVKAGSQHSCALLDNGSVKCWGRAYTGAMGYGDGITRGDEANEMGTYLPEVGLGTNVVGISLSGISSLAHTCVLTNAGSKCWGLGSSGPNGYGDAITRGDHSNEMGTYLPAQDFGTNKIAVAASANRHACVILEDRSVKCWGYSTEYQAGYGDTIHRGDNSSEMGTSLPALSLGTSAKARSIDVSSPSTCVLLYNGRMKCWGDNTYGDAGAEADTIQGSSSHEMGDALDYVDLE
jgi:alpha-tubulin suppressor-like RCC1 family protein